MTAFDDTWRKCEFCGCNTNARLRRCCERGTDADLGHNTGAIDEFFGLGRTEYLTVPRRVLNSMPPEWQERFAACMKELDDTLDWRPESGQYWVELRDSNGRIAKCPHRDYRRSPLLKRKVR